jgi:SAM-dependent methyltransferase
MDIVSEYYKDSKKQTFYQKYWGGESIHVGIYQDEMDNEINNLDLGTIIRYASKFKSHVMANLVKSYLLDDRHNSLSNTVQPNFKLADWGSGYGGTARRISNKWESVLNLSIACYDLSHINCEYNAKVNLMEDYSNIAIHNQSFLEIDNRWFDLIYSEDSFVHIDDKNLIFERAYNNLNKGGHLIFSDIILKDPDNCSAESLAEISRRISVNTVGSKESYIRHALDNNFKLCNVIEYNSDIKKHYKYVKKFYQETEPAETQSNEIVAGLDDWIKHADNDNITMAIFIFMK